MRRVPCGKARGPDGLPGELLRHQPTGVARLLYPQLIKMILHGQEHLGYKGGMLQPAYKGRGPMDSCHSYRSLLISSHLGKVLHRTIRTKQSMLYEKFMQHEQTGGRTKVPVQLAMHQLRAFARQAKQKNLSAGIVYLDLTEAFYTVMREATLGGEPTDAVIAHVLRRLNMAPNAMHDIYHLLEEPPAVQQAGFHEVDQQCWQAVHTGTYFWIAEQGDVSRTRMGTSIADVVFGYAWSCVLKRLQQSMADQQMLTCFEAQHHLPLFGNYEATGTSSTFMGPTWMDDTAVCIQAEDPQQLVHNVSYVAGHTFRPVHSPLPQAQFGEGRDRSPTDAERTWLTTDETSSFRTRIYRHAASCMRRRSESNPTCAMLWPPWRCHAPYGRPGA